MDIDELLLKYGSDFLIDVSKRIAALDHQAQKVALVQEIFGRSGIEVLPLLEDLAKGLRK